MTTKLHLPVIFGIAAAVFFPATITYAAEEAPTAEYDALRRTVDDLSAQLDSLRAELAALEATTAAQPAVVTQTPADMANAAAGTSVFHLSGYADAGYYGSENGSGSFAIGHFSPILHYQFEDRVLLESELALGVEDQATGTTTETEVEYMTIDLILNDYATLIAGKFLSPVGNFQQNLHPSWINKLPSPPVGFATGHGGSGPAPFAEVGVQLRGGIPAGSGKVNYAFYGGNGPALIVEGEHPDLEIEGVDTSGRLSSDGTLAVGGRVGILPIPGLELGASFAAATAAVASGGGHADHDEEAVMEEEATIGDRDYRVFDLDFNFTPPNLRDLRLRGEYVETRLGAGTIDEPDPEKKTWEAWYVEASYFWSPQLLEPVVRYGRYENPHGERLTQWAFGLNYRLASNVIGKLAYQLNDSNEPVDPDNQIAVQLSYGF